jgi:hypothetical protein
LPRLTDKPAQDDRHGSGVRGDTQPAIQEQAVDRSNQHGGGLVGCGHPALAQPAAEPPPESLDSAADLLAELLVLGGSQPHLGEQQR